MAFDLDKNKFVGAAEIRHVLVNIGEQVSIGKKQNGANNEEGLGESVHGLNFWQRGPPEDPVDSKRNNRLRTQKNLSVVTPLF